MKREDTSLSRGAIKATTLFISIMLLPKLSAYSFTFGVMIKFLFKQPKPRRFEYKPRFYDERKERLQARVEAIRRETENEEGASSPEVLRSRMQSAWRSDERRSAVRKSNRSVFIIAGLLVIIAYLLLRQ